MRNKQRKTALQQAKQPNRPNNDRSAQAQKPPVLRSAAATVDNNQRSWSQVAGASKPPSKPSPQGPDPTLSLILNEIKGLRADMLALTRRVDAIEQRPKPGRISKTKS